MFSIIKRLLSIKEEQIKLERERTKDIKEIKNIIDDLLFIIKKKN